MTHELKNIFKEFQKANNAKIRCVLATVVDLEGSSYRKPGVRMLIREDDKMIGAVSGGCVEKEILFQTQSVFQNNTAKLMNYDGRYRLGCEGILYVLLEPFSPSNDLLFKFQKTIKNRKSFELQTSYQKEFGKLEGYGTFVLLDSETFAFNSSTKKQPDALHFEQTMQPCKRLLLIGGEHDVVQLSHFGLSMGWEVTVAVTPKENKSLADFPGIETLLNYEPENFPIKHIDSNTAVILMTHSYVKDLKYLMVLKNTQPIYLGLLGPAKRREKLLATLIEEDMDIALDFLERIHGPAGLNIGAETPQEIAISILSEILTVIRKTNPMMLKDIGQKIYD
ncbi:XdhC family protein [Maribacter sp. ACAM166]|uniref:XdhC family protein n=1 Tax=Maribacter sp. ACAM166 TaxID=2508996 RepID=UPI0010FDB928|nr:XdhC/CoxI family protein [Maribacter sp. ACAM166]TLP79197.1 XdhC family protein [Maribacter sp. ACAM166]